MMNTDPDDTAEPGAITDDDPDGHHDDQDTASWEGPAAVAPETGGYAGPECGATAARAHFMVLYRAAGGGVDLAEFDSCCRLHEPAGFTILIDEAEVIQTDIADGYEQVIRTDVIVTTLHNRSPGHSIDPAQPWAWTLADNHPVRVDQIGPHEQGWFHVAPRPAQAHRQRMASSQQCRSASTNDSRTEPHRPAWVRKPTGKEDRARSRTAPTGKCAASRGCCPNTTKPTTTKLESGA